MTTAIRISEVFAFFPAVLPGVVRASEIGSLESLALDGDFPHFISRVEELACVQMPSNSTLGTRARMVGLSRSSSASLAGCMAAVLCHEGLSLESKVARTGLFVCSTSSSASIAYKFERYGMDHGWNIVDPFWLPNAIPTAIATSIFSMLKLNGMACGYPGGIQGFFSALDQAAMVLVSGEVEQAIVLIAEERTEYHAMLVERHAVRDHFPNAAVGILLSYQENDPDNILPQLVAIDLGNQHIHNYKPHSQTLPLLPQPGNIEIVLNQYNIAHSFVPILMLFGARTGHRFPRVPGRYRFFVTETSENFSVSVEN